MKTGGRAEKNRIDMKNTGIKSLADNRLLAKKEPSAKKEHSAKKAPTANKKTSAKKKPVAKKKPLAKKQRAKTAPKTSTHVDSIQYLGTTALRSSHPEIRKLKRQGHEPSIHGTKVWRSSFVVMKYLKQHPIPERAKVMDIGCGWGLTGIYLAKRYAAEVTGIDADASVKPYLDAQAKVNGVNISFEQKKFEQIRRHEMRGMHTLVGSDVCFWDEMVHPLYNLVIRATDVGVKQVLIADPGRSPFWKLAKLCEKELDAEVMEISIAKPYKTRKQILVVRPRP
jgi:predicted nicotinamide N-methyase